MPFSSAKANHTADLFGLPKAGIISAYDARVDYDHDRIHITMTGDHGAPDLARQLLDEVASAGHIHPIDQDIARQMIHDYSEVPKPAKRQTIVGTRISVSRKHTSPTAGAGHQLPALTASAKQAGNETAACYARRA